MWKIRIEVLEQNVVVYLSSIGFGGVSCYRLIRVTGEF